jgi:tripartite-type tricarboxylate transporter receptor subunit TctC
MKFRKMFLALSILFVAVLPGNVFSAARDYPNRQIEIVVPMAPGGTTDVCVRILSEELSKNLGVPVIVSNKPGGSGAAAAEYVAKAKPDGYTLLSPTNTVFVTLPLTVPSVSYKWSDFVPIIRVANIPLIIFTKAESPFNSMADIAAYARKNPGKLNCGLVGAGSTTHFDFELWRGKEGVDIGFIPYQGGGPLLTAQLGGHVDFGVINLPPIYGLVKSGKIKLIAATGKLKEFPQVPTFAEIGFPECNIGVWVALVAPGKTPKEIADILAKASLKVLQNPVVIDKMEKLSYTVEAMDAKTFSTAMSNEIKLLSPIKEKVLKSIEGK